MNSAIAEIATTKMSRRRFMRASLTALPLSAFAMAACGTGEQSVGETEDLAGITPEEVLQKLRDGNTRFVEMELNGVNQSTDRRIAVASGQTPFAGIIGCVDSRVPPELVFDRGLGDLFVTRVGAAIADDSIVGSIEFGVTEFGIPLVVVLGHSSYGAVRATVEAVESGDLSAPGQIGAVVGPIVPAVEEVVATGAEATLSSISPFAKVSTCQRPRSARARCFRDRSLTAR